MIRLRRWQQLALGFAFSLPIIGGWLAGVWLPLGLTTAAVLGWLAGRRRGWDTGMAALIVWSGGAAWLVSQGVAVGWLLGGMAAALAAVDLDELARQAAGAEETDALALLLETHLRWLGGALALGGALSVGALLFQTQLTFGLLFLAALLVLLALSRAWRQLPP